MTLGATPFGMVGVRMAKTIGVNDGGGLIRNSEGNVNEQGPNGVFRKKARWVDYSGPITDSAAEGITLFDHPSNPNHPSHFHVRNDGWMGASLTLEKPITITPGEPLRLAVWPVRPRWRAGRFDDRRALGFVCQIRRRTSTDQVIHLGQPARSPGGCRAVRRAGTRGGGNG